MRELIKHINKNIDNLSKKEQKDILKFSNRLDTYIHVPTNEKEIKRMESFATNEDLVQFILGKMKTYNYPKDNAYPFDMISYWYCLMLLIKSKQNNAKDFVLNLINQFLKTEHKDLWQFRRCLEFINDANYKNEKGNIESYFLSKQKGLESYKWAKQIGLELPKDNSWMFFFEISTDGKFRFGNDLSDLEKEERLRINVSVYPLRGEKCWEIELKNWKNSISAWWPNLSECEIRLNNKKTIILKTKPSLQNLKSIIDEIESIFNVTFDRTIYSKTFKGKNKNAVQKWLLE